MDRQEVWKEMQTGISSFCAEGANGWTVAMADSEGSQSRSDMSLSFSCGSHHSGERSAERSWEQACSQQQRGRCAPGLVGMAPNLRGFRPVLPRTAPKRESVKVLRGLAQRGHFERVGHFEDRWLAGAQARPAAAAAAAARQQTPPPRPGAPRQDARSPAPAAVPSESRLLAAAAAMWRRPPAVAEPFRGGDGCGGRPAPQEGRPEEEEPREEARDGQPQAGQKMSL